MILFKLKVTVVLATFGIAAGYAIADSQVDKNMKNAETVYKQKQKEKQNEELRDKSHDLPRIKVEKNTSVGVDPMKNEVNVKKTY